ncbi:MAG: hypothetical protein OXG04_22885 [Acidobacteria bacterium]|nr:hypothetical protein [Acidobacteriota bacterium]
MGEARGPLVVTGAELPQHGQQGVAHQRVDLVDQQHERPRVGLRPAGEHVDQRAVRALGLQCGAAEAVRGLVTQRDARPAGQFAEHRPHRPRRVLARRLPDLEVRVDAAVVAGGAAVQEVAQRQQGRRLARLPRRMQHEVLLAADEVQHLFEVDPLERRDAVVVVGTNRTLGIEEAHRLHSGNPRPACHPPQPSRSPRRGMR